MRRELIIDGRIDVAASKVMYLMSEYIVPFAAAAWGGYSIPYSNSLTEIGMKIGAIISIGIVTGRLSVGLKRQALVYGFDVEHNWRIQK